MTSETEVQKTIKYYYQEIERNPGTPYAVSAVDTMLHFIKTYNAETMLELQKMMREIIEMLIKENVSMSVVSGCELFVRYITLASIEHQDFAECKKVLVTRGENFITRCLTAKHVIGSRGHQFIKNGSRILTHSNSRVVFEVFLHASRKKKHFDVYVTESHPDNSGKEMVEMLKSIGVPAILVIDSAVGFLMEKIDVVFFGSEGVVESGGIINKIGTYQIAVMAKHQRVPVYVAVESFKFIRFYPLKQSDLPNVTKYEPGTVTSNNLHPKIDYTPPDYISFLITDIGILTPSAVSDELIKLYL